MKERSAANRRFVRPASSTQGVFPQAAPRLMLPPAAAVEKMVRFRFLEVCERFHLFTTALQSSSAKPSMGRIEEIHVEEARRS